jgi:hypothetical protein
MSRPLANIAAPPLLLTAIASAKSSCNVAITNSGARRSFGETQLQPREG